MKIFSKNAWGVDVNNAWPLTCKASCLKRIELRPLISGFDFALLEIRNLCVASRLYGIILKATQEDRYYNVPRSLKLCSTCKVLHVDNEFHFFLLCKINNSLRQFSINN